MIRSNANEKEEKYTNGTDVSKLPTSQKINSTATHTHTHTHTDSVQAHEQIGNVKRTK